MTLAITKGLTQKDPLVVRLHGPMRLAIPERNVPGKVLVHRDVGVKPHLDEASSTGFGFGVNHELSPNAAPLRRRCDGEGVDKHVVLVHHEDENAGNFAGGLEHIHVVVLDPLRMIIDHRFWSSPI